MGRQMRLHVYFYVHRAVLYFPVSREGAGEFSECMHDMDRARIGHGEGGLSKVYRQHTYSIASTHIPANCKTLERF
jgi:hypothetical protein